MPPQLRRDQVVTRLRTVVLRRAAHSAEGRTFVLPPTAFWQAHSGAPTRYRELVRELLPEVHGGAAWDLYGGIGLFADILAEKTRGPVDLSLIHI